MELQTMFTIDLINLTNQFAHILDESPERKNIKILNFQLHKMKVSLEHQKPSFCYYCQKKKKIRTLDRRLSQT